MVAQTNRRQAQSASLIFRIISFTIVRICFLFIYVLCVQNYKKKLKKKNFLAIYKAWEDERRIILTLLLKTGGKFGCLWNLLYLCHKI